MEEKLKISAIDCRHYYQLGMVVDNDYDFNDVGVVTTGSKDSDNNNLSDHEETSNKNSLDNLSECGSEDVDKFPDDVVMKETTLDNYGDQPVYNLAEELKLHDFYNGFLNPIVFPNHSSLSSNFVNYSSSKGSSSPTSTGNISPVTKRAKGISPVSSSSSALDEALDWDLVIGSSSPDAVDLVIRNQPVTQPEDGYSVSVRRRIVHRVTNNLDGFDPTCGKCCVLQ